jgi:mRNA interferase RelE/StbE
MPYTPTFKPSFFKDLKKLPKDIRERITLSIDRIIENPLSVSAKQLKGHSHIYRYRLGDYRLVYYIQHHRKKIMFLLVAHRKDIYKSLKKIT